MASNICGCYFLDPTAQHARRTYLPQIKFDAHTTIQSLASRTVLKQTFSNPSSERNIDEIRYAFPLFDGVGVVDFVCTVGERTIYGLVKEKNEAKKTYEKAKERGEQAALLEQLPDAADVFITSISNIAPESTLEVTITYVQELKHDAEVDGIRFTLPSRVAPRYGSYPGTLIGTIAAEQPDISITVDIDFPDGIPIKKVMSPSHPIEISGSLSTSSTNQQSSVSKASATLALGNKPFDKEFILQIIANDIGIPHAVLETHSTLPNQRALLATLVPKFSLKHHKPEILFLADRSGSMETSIPTLVAALKNFLKSIPPGCHFNVISFGNDSRSLWPTSQLYTQTTLDEAIRHVGSFDADFGGTETLYAIKKCLSARSNDLSTEIILLTDGDIWAKQAAFDYVAEATKNQDIRVFPIGIGNGVSSAFIEGIARAGNGFGQMIGNAEKMTSKIVRMLKAALTPHVKDYRLEIKYEDGTLENAFENLNLSLESGTKENSAPQADAKPISLYDEDYKEELSTDGEESEGVTISLPNYNPPKIFQAPFKIPQLYPFHRTCVYLLMGPETSRLSPKSIVLKGTSFQGPLAIEIPIEIRKKPDQMIHQLAARKATQELEEGGGWATEARVDSGKLLRDDQPTLYEQLLRKEAVRLGVEFQVGGKHCSFVAVEANNAETAEKRKNAFEAVDTEDSHWDIVEDADIDDWYDTAGRERRALGRKRRWKRRAVIDVEAEVDDFELFLHGGTADLGEAADLDTWVVSGASGFVTEQVTSTGSSGEDAIPQSHKSPHDSSTSPVLSQHVNTNPSAPLLERLVDQQSFDGSWPNFDSIPWNEMGLNPADVEEIAEKLARMASQEVDRISVKVMVSTVLAILYAEKKMADEEETWGLVVEKARTFLEEMDSKLGKDIVDECWRLGESLM